MASISDDKIQLSIDLHGDDLDRYREVVRLRIAVRGHPAGKIRWVDGVACKADDIEPWGDPTETYYKMLETQLRWQAKRKRTTKRTGGRDSGD